MHRLLAYVLLFFGLSVLLFGCGREPASPAGDDSVRAADGQVESPITEPSADRLDTVGDSAESPASREVAVTVNGRSVDREAFDEAKEAVMAQYQQIYAQFGMDIRSMMIGAEGRIFELNLESSAVDRLVFDALVDEEAQRRGMSVSQDDVEAEFQRQYAAFLAYQGLTEETLAAYLESQGGSLDQFVESAHRGVQDQLLLEAVQRAVAGSIDLSEDDLATYFDENRAQYDTNEQVRASHILVDTDEEAQQILEALEAGAEFATLAIENSTCPSAPAGGDLGWFERGQMVGEFEEAVFALNVNEISDVVQTEFGFHVILLTDHKEATHPDLAEVIEQVRDDAEEEIVEERFRHWYEEIYPTATVTVHLPLVDAIRKQIEDIDLGLAAFSRLKEEAIVDDPYLPFIIGSIYQTKMNDAIVEKEELEAAETEDPERSDRLAALDVEIETARDNALAFYREALDQLGEDAEIAATIKLLEPQTPSQVTP